jgi:hypothetical protein
MTAHRRPAGVWIQPTLWIRLWKKLAGLWISPR